MAGRSTSSSGSGNNNTLHKILGGLVLIAIIWASSLSVLLQAAHKATPVSQTSQASADYQLGYQLASEQSFGFFDDIPDDQWKRLQKIHATLFPNHHRKDLTKYANGIGDSGNYDKLKMSSWWNAENFQEEIHCLTSQRIPADSNGDGPKWVCDPHRIAKRPDCLVYSVGSNGNVMFEKGVKELIGPHCEIHTFDMVTYNKRNGHFEKALEGYASFHAWGLGTQAQADHYAKTGRGSAIKTLAQTMSELGHTDRRVDIFKIDCEWCEWHTYRDWLAAGNLRQILVETHNAPLPNARDFFYELHDAGYVIYSKEGNLQNGGGGVEFGFLKLRSDFFVNGTTYKERGLRTEAPVAKR
jgi:hypothetical protein